VSADKSSIIGAPAVTPRFGKGTCAAVNSTTRLQWYCLQQPCSSPPLAACVQLLATPASIMRICIAVPVEWLELVHMAARAWRCMQQGRGKQCLGTWLPMTRHFFTHLAGAVHARLQNRCVWGSPIPLVAWAHEPPHNVASSGWVDLPHTGAVPLHV
jgi:hypothetical protein